MHYPSRTSLQGSELIETVAEFRGDVERNGFAFVGGVSSQATLDYLRASLEQISDTGYLRKRGGIFAIRNLLDVSPEMREVTDSEAVRALVAPVLGEQFFPADGMTGCLGRRKRSKPPHGCFRHNLKHITGLLFACRSGSAVQELKAPSSGSVPSPDYFATSPTPEVFGITAIT